ncbi:DUF4126 family protein [Fulvivirga sediminis]|uniref:DUF4126 family protein n=1 Tax=Fulvivirga sediminis TaxID=2803949 RepID=A0A937K0W5_9BACT|nr:DUF4126 family protein [Fulvivirga sediminis]MBL3658014.1 DUF4126 family protein [Fulvivirga sediminis]
MISVLTKTIGLGAVTGLRSMLGPAMLCFYLNREPQSFKRRALKLSSLQKVTTVMAVGELIGDKLPFAPDRVNPTALAGRALMGALVGAILFKDGGKSAYRGGIIGGVTAMLAAGVGYYLRKKVGQATEIEDPYLGAAEDLIAIGSGFTMVTY